MNHIQDIENAQVLQDIIDRLTNEMIIPTYTFPNEDSVRPESTNGELTDVELSDTTNINTTHLPSPPAYPPPSDPLSPLPPLPPSPPPPPLPRRTNYYNNLPLPILPSVYPSNMTRTPSVHNNRTEHLNINSDPIYDYNEDHGHEGHEDHEDHELSLIHI